MTKPTLAILTVAAWIAAVIGLTAANGYEPMQELAAFLRLIK